MAGLTVRTVRRSQAVVFKNRETGLFHFIDCKDDRATPSIGHKTLELAREAARVQLGTDRWLADFDSRQQRLAEEVNALMRW